MSTELEHVEGSVEQDGPAQELMVPSLNTSAIIRADEPVEIITKATAIADALKGLIERQNLSTDVGGGRKHVNVEGWQALGAMLGALGGQALHAETVWTRRVMDEDGRPKRTQYTARVKRYHRRDQGGGVREETTYEVDGFDWEACVEVRTTAGAVVGRAEAMCSREESTWAQRDEYAVRSMAETRAESRAYRRAVGWIVGIAGYSPTPAEEVPPQHPAAVEIPSWAERATPDNQAAAHAAYASLTSALGASPEDAQAAWLRIGQAFGGTMPAGFATALVAVASLVPQEVPA
jgi:hypothetical protein